MILALPIHSRFNITECSICHRNVTSKVNWQIPEFSILMIYNRESSFFIVIFLFCVKPPNTGMPKVLIIFV